MFDCVDVPPLRFVLDEAPLAVYVPPLHVNCSTLFTVRTLLELPVPVIVLGAVKYTEAPPAFDVRKVPLIVPGLLSAALYPLLNCEKSLLPQLKLLVGAAFVLNEIVAMLATVAVTSNFAVFVVAAEAVIGESAVNAGIAASAHAAANVPSRLNMNVLLRMCAA
jgi:hypothetical protein